MTQKFLTFFKNTKTRTLVLVIGSTLVAGVIFLIANLNGASDPIKENASKVVGVPRDAQTVPGVQTSEQYSKLLSEENAKRAEEAEKNKQSAIPTFNKSQGTENQNIFTGPDGGLPGNGLPGNGLPGNGLPGNGLPGNGLPGSALSTNNPFGNITQGGLVGGATLSPRDQQRQLEEERQKRLDEQKKNLAEIENTKRLNAEMEQRRKDLEAAEKQYAQSVQEATTQMANYAKAATTTWVNVNPQVYVEGVFADKGKKSEKESNGSQSSSTGTANNNTRVNNNNNIPRELIKAGTILYGVLDTAINSDESGPVLATVVSGKYKGARLIGKLQLPTNASKVIISFSTMSLPRKKESLGIDAVAIDTETARTAFASDVDNHYLLRYGSLFASSFVEGFGKAVGQQGTTITDPNGTQTQTRDKLSSKDQVLSAFGTVGEQWSKQVEPLFKTPVTVTVDQGLGIGVLFMRDIDVSNNTKETNNVPAVSLVTPTTATPNK